MIAIKSQTTFTFLVVIKDFRNGQTQEILIEPNQPLYENQVSPAVIRAFCIKES